MKHAGIVTLVLLGQSSSVALKTILRKRLSDRSESLFPHFICELLKVCIELFCKPIEFVKHYLVKLLLFFILVLLSQENPSMYRSIRGGFGKLVNKHGVGALFTRWFPTLLGYIAQGSVKFVFYEYSSYLIQVYWDTNTREN